jgi:hypothetical protein
VTAGGEKTGGTSGETGPARRPGAAPAGKARRGDARRARPVVWAPTKLTNRDRLRKLTARQKKLLGTQGFFLAPQPSPKPGERATHLFHVYERNDYIQFPSFVTVDLAIDATHAYFNAVLREVESQHLVPRLEAALRALLRESERVRRTARAPRARRAAARAVTYWAVALRLLQKPARGDAPDVLAPRRPPGAPPAARPRQPPVKLTPVPRAVRGKVARVVRRVQAARGRLPAGLLRAKLDLTQMKPRGHYTRTGVLQRFFRSMSWLGMARFPVEGPKRDLAAVALLARSYLGTKAGRRALEQVKTVTTFFAGGPDAADLGAAARLLVQVLPGARRARADRLLRPKLLSRYGKKLAALPPPRIRSSASGANEPPQVRVMGRRAFEDNVALQQLIGALDGLAMRGGAGRGGRGGRAGRGGRRGRREAKARGRSPAMVRAPGALGSAALLGSELAKSLIVRPAPGFDHPALGRAIDQGRGHLTKLPATRWHQDAYHGTLHALRALLPVPPDSAPRLLKTPAWRRRALQAFAGGWAELRHDTILYGEQSGAECDAPDPPAPPAWVEPVPAVYDRLAKMVQALDKRLRAAGVAVKARPAGGNPYARPLAAKTKQAVKLLTFLRDVARAERQGLALTPKQRKRITLIGGEVEWLLISLANTDLLARRDQDMAVVADVFTWRSLGKAVEVAVAHPDLIYAIIPGPKGPVLARGAVMSYREFLQPVTDRLTDERWRKRLAAGKAPARPAWVEPLYAEPVPYIKVDGRGVSRCGPSSGAGLKL